MPISISEAAQLIRAQTKSNLSSIDDGQMIEVPLSVGGIAPVLMDLKCQNDQIDSVCIRSRYVILTQNCRTLMTTSISDVAIEGVIRANAANAYFEQVRKTTEGSINIGLVLRGKLNLPMFKDVVTLSSSNTIVGHLLELLGADIQLVFSLRLGSNEHWVFQFEHDESIELG